MRPAKHTKYTKKVFAFIVCFVGSDSNVTM